jgi:hypothetical protein
LGKFEAMSSRSAPRFGVCEVFAQSATISFVRNEEWHNHIVHVPPRILENQKASTIYRACNLGIPQLSIDGVTKLADMVRFLLIDECPDHAASNKKNMFFALSKYPANVFFIPGGCGVHSCHRIIVNIGERKLLGDAYAAKFVMHLSSHYNRMYRQLHELVRSELLVLPRNSVTDADVQAWAAHAEAVLEHTLFRTAHQTRGRLDDVDNSLFESTDEAKLRRKANKVRSFCNGDWRRQRLIHVCDGCCDSEEQSQEQVFLAIAESGLLLGESGLPSESKWGSMTKSVSEIAFGLMFHGCFPRTFARAFEKYEDGAINADGNDVGEDSLSHAL